MKLLDIVKGLLSAFFGERQILIDDLGIERMETVFVLMGKAFGPDGIRHFSQLSMLEQASLLSRVPVLRTTHGDWIKPLRHIPRTLTTWVGPSPSKLTVLAGNTTNYKPIPAPGEWWVMRGVFTITFDNGIHVRFGWRYDDVDFYWTAPSFTIKRV